MTCVVAGFLFPHFTWQRKATQEPGHFLNHSVKKLAYRTSVLETVPTASISCHVVHDYFQRAVTCWCFTKAVLEHGALQARRILSRPTPCCWDSGSDRTGQGEWGIIIIQWNLGSLEVMSSLQVTSALWQVCAKHFISIHSFHSQNDPRTLTLFYI